MSYLDIKKTRITEEEVDLMLNIYNSDLSDSVKAMKFEEIISYRELNNCVRRINFNKDETYNKAVILVNIYEKFKKKGLFKDWYKCDTNELKNRLNSLNLIYKTLKSDLSEEEKIEIIFGIYKDKEEFNKKYTLLVKYGACDPRLDSAREALDNYDFISNVVNSFSDVQIKNIRQKKENEVIIKENYYLENYLYAEYVIKTYISDDKSYLKNKFLEDLGISEEIFRYCEELIRFLNPVLYGQYQECVSNNNKKRSWAIARTIRDLTKGINTGTLEDGTKFDLLEFYKRVPFKEYGKDFVPTLKDYIYRNFTYDKGVYYAINTYLYQNQISRITPASESVLIKTSVSYKGLSLTPEIIHNVFRYMKINGLPIIMGVYRIVLDKYINNEIDFSLLDEQEKQLERIQNSYNNPYTLVLKKD